MRDIAEATGLSSATVSYALRGLHVPVSTQQRVQAVAKEIGYQADPIARALASGRSGYVGVLCGSQEDAWQQTVATAVGRGLLEVELNALVVDAANSPALEESLAQRLVDQRVDALIVLPVDPLGRHWKSIAAQTVLVSIGDSLPKAPTAAEVVYDNAAGVSDALTQLARAGHRRITVLTPSGVATPDRPAEVVVKSLAASLTLDIDVRTAPHDLEGSAAVVHQILTGPDRPTAFFCLADSIAYGVYSAARQLNMAVPQDVSVIGFDDRPMSSILSPPLSSYRWPIDELVAAVVERTVNGIESGKRTRKKVLAGTPQLRGSVAQLATR